MKRWLAGYGAVVKALVLTASAVGGLCIVIMMLLTCADVLLRLWGRPLVGVYDVVRMAGAMAMACALPYTTAVKGHVAIEFFFHKLSRRWRIAVDTVMRLLVMALFGMLARHFILYGLALRRAGEMTPTLGLPVFWVPYVLAGSCGLVMLVVLQNLLHPGKEMIKP